MVVWSCVVHLGALGLVLVSPGGDAMRAPAVIDVELMGLPQPAAPAPARSRPAPPAPAPRAEPEPEPIPAPPPPPKPEAIVLPEKPTQAPKPEPKPAEPEREVFREPEKKEEKSLDELMEEMRGEKSREELLAEMREAAGETEPGGEPVETAQAPSAAATGGGGSALTAEERDWHRRVRQHMKGRWILPAGFRTQVLQTIVSVRLDRAGTILGDPEIVRRSGNPWYDDSVMRGLGKASPLPPPPEAGDWHLVFRPEDSF